MSRRRRDPVEEAARRREELEAARRRKARELEDLGEPEAAAEVLAGRCACQCGQPIPGSSARTFYLEERHRKRAHERRVKRAAEARGVPARFSLQRLEGTVPITNRPADAQRPRQRRQTKPREGVTIYLPTLDAAELLRRILANHAQSREAVNPPAAVPYRELADVVDAALERRRKRDARAAARARPRAA